MAISDKNPERRNLALASLAFILYYGAGGEFIGNTVQLLVINLKFSNPNALGIFAWIMLIWFGVRFWQKRGFNYLHSLYAETDQDALLNSVEERMIIKASEQFEKRDMVDSPSTIIEFDRNLFKLIPFGYRGHCNLIKGENRSILEQTWVTLRGVRESWEIFKLALIEAIRGNVFSELAIPYLLFLMAITGPIWSPYSLAP